MFDSHNEMSQKTRTEILVEDVQKLLNDSRSNGE